jgi:hypothetical protein
MRAHDKRRGDGWNRPPAWHGGVISMQHNTVVVGARRRLGGAS